MVQERVREILEELLGADMGTVTVSTELRDELGLDALAIIDLVCALEVAFDVSVPEVGELSTFGDLCVAVAGSAAAA